MENERSFIYVENLAYFVWNIISENKEGVFMPMDSQRESTDTMAKFICSANNKEIKFSPLFGKIVKKIPLNSLKKAFGSLYYRNDIAEFYWVSRGYKLHRKNFLGVKKKYLTGKWFCCKIVEVLGVSNFTLHYITGD